MRFRTTVPHTSFLEGSIFEEEEDSERLRLLREFLSEAMASDTLRVSLWSFFWTREGSLTGSGRGVGGSSDL